jgi:hypothetical protein
VVCDDLAMNGVFPLEDFNRYVAVSVMCLWVTLLEIALETTWDFIWGVFDTCARLYLRFYLLFVVFLYLYNIIYIYLFILLVTLLGITSVASGYVIGLFMFCFCLSFCKTVRSNTGKFYLLAMIKLYNMLFVGILCILFVGIPR